jgi:hypothetical protein
METSAGAPQPKPPRSIDEKLLAAAKKMRRRPPWARPYATGRTRALWLKIFLLASVGGCASLALGVLLASQLVTGPLDDPKGLSPAAALSVLLAGLSSLLAVGCELTAFVLLLVWLHRAYRNLFALGARGFGDSPAWAVGSFFIPAVNFYLPYRIVTDIWNGSRLAPAAGETARRRAGIVPLVLVWWLVWMGAKVVNMIIGIAGSSPAREDRPFQNPGGLLLSCLLGIAAHLLTFFVVRAIQDMQDAKWAQSLPVIAEAADPNAPPAAPW